MASRYYGELEVALRDARGFVDGCVQEGDWVLLCKLRGANLPIVIATIEYYRSCAVDCLSESVWYDFQRGDEWDYELWHIVSAA